MVAPRINRAPALSVGRLQFGDVRRDVPALAGAIPRQRFRPNLRRVSFEAIHVDRLPVNGDAHGQETPIAGCVQQDFINVG